MNLTNLSPMMAKYLQTKEEYSDCILFYRLGDFYEMFFDDAINVSRELELTLTGKSCGLEERAPMCGVPFHSAAVYIARLVEKGYKVAICEQVEDPKNARGLVKREVVRVVTPGTVIDETMLDDKANNYLCSLCREEDGSTSLAFADISTGEVYATRVSGFEEAVNEIARYSPSEVVINEAAKADYFDFIKNRFCIAIDVLAERYFTADNIEKELIKQFGMTASGADRAVFAMVGYIKHTQKAGIAYINSLNVYKVEEYMDIDLSTRCSLEITETMRDKSKRGSLLGILDKTSTSMGARKLRSWVEKPLVNPIEINKRLYSVNELAEDMIFREELEEALGGIYDISRIIGRVSQNTANPRDMVALKCSILKLPELYGLLSKAKSPILSQLYKQKDELSDIAELLEAAICDEPPITLKDGGVIRTGYNQEVDSLRLAQTEGKKWLLAEEAKEKEQTGIKNLKISYNKVFGYYIEVTKSNLSLVPDYYIRKQTLTNCERFITPRLKELENTILGAGERVTALETAIYEEIRAKVSEQVERLKNAAETIATCDVITSLATVAAKNNYTMPEISNDGVTEIKGGRHPVVEGMMKNSLFVPNDTLLDTKDNRLLIITGPNMAGKSTYMRQVALITLMAQVGSFVPCEYARISVADRIFTRVGASDDISRGQSTFMLEMVEVANILKNATDKSLVIMDEIGRGTSTFDGLSIAWAVAEYIRKKVGAKTLFATHYHELCELEEKMEGVKNYNVAVKKRGDDITFLRKIVRGGADDSYGIEVAALAGVPNEVIKRAKEILKKVENDEIGDAYKSDKKQVVDSGQISFGDSIDSEIADELRNMDATTFTPIEALNKLYELSCKAKNMN